MLVRECEHVRGAVGSVFRALQQCYARAHRRSSQLEERDAPVKNACDKSRAHTRRTSRPLQAMYGASACTGSSRSAAAAARAAPIFSSLACHVSILVGAAHKNLKTNDHSCLFDFTKKM